MLGKADPDRLFRLSVACIAKSLCAPPSRNFSSKQRGGLGSVLLWFAHGTERFRLSPKFGSDGFSGGEKFLLCVCTALKTKTRLWFRFQFSKDGSDEFSSVFGS